MTKAEYIHYWRTTAETDWEVVANLFDKGQYPQALFFGHLVLEKLIKAHWVKDNQEDFPPRIHNLVRLASQTALTFEQTELDFLVLMNQYQLEGRYPDYQLTIYRACTKDLTEPILLKINQLRTWLVNQLP